MDSNILIALISATPAVITGVLTYKISKKPVMNGKFTKVCDDISQLKEDVIDVKEKCLNIKSEVLAHRQEDAKIIIDLQRKILDLDK